MKLTTLLASAIGLCLGAQAQEVKKPRKHSVQISYTDQHYFNSEYIHTDHAFPEPMTAPNTRGYNFAVNYQYAFKFGLTLNGSVQYGKQKHLLNLDYDLSGMDSMATYNLRDRTYHTSYSFEPQYLSNRVMIGYIKALPFKAARGWSAEVKAGVASKLIKGQMPNQMMGEEHRVWYRRDIPNHVAGIIVADVRPYMGHNDKWNLLKPNYHRYVHTFEGYLGLRRDLDNGILKYFSIGSEFTRSIDKYKDNISVATYTLELASGYDYYYDKQLSVGLLIGGGFGL